MTPVMFMQGYMQGQQDQALAMLSNGFSVGQKNVRKH